MKFILKAAIITHLLISSILYANNNDHSGNHMHNGEMSNHSNLNNTPSIILKEAGNDIFGTIQELISKLSNDPNTNWEKVNIEILRQHLLDMNDMTFNVELISQRAIKNGVESIIKAKTKRSEEALERIFQAHPSQLKKETNWDMHVLKNNGQYILSTTTTNQKDIPKIRALGYIGLMAIGSHHQKHHLLMATGGNPHH